MSKLIIVESYAKTKTIKKATGVRAFKIRSNMKMLFVIGI
jgi:DNA topoisomerase IA